MVIHTFNPSTYEAEEGGSVLVCNSEFQDSQLNTEALYKKINFKK